MSRHGQRVAVTGLGAIAALGHDVPSIWRGMLAGSCGIGPISSIATDRLSVGVAAEIRDFKPEVHFDERQLPLLDRTTQLALVAAREAMAGTNLDCLKPRRGGVVLGAGVGQLTQDASYNSLYRSDAKRLHPLTLPRGMPSAPASHLSIEFGLRGASFGVASACASASHAIALAYQMIKSGSLDMVLTGGSDASICLGYMKAWEALRILSPDTCRPFSRDRAGLVIGEGAAVLVLESWGHAVARGAVIHAEIIGVGMSADAHDMTAPDADGAAWAMMDALADSRLTPEQVEYVNAHGTGTKLNDKTEVFALKRVFRRHLQDLPVSSSKSMLGHCLNAGGALELVATILALRDGVLPPTAGFREADPDCDIDCVPNQARSAPIEVAMSNSFAFGGLNAALIVRKPT